MTLITIADLGAKDRYDVPQQFYAQFITQDLLAYIDYYFVQQGTRVLPRDLHLS